MRKHVRRNIKDKRRGTEKMNRKIIRDNMYEERIIFLCDVYIKIKKNGKKEKKKET